MRKVVTCRVIQEGKAVSMGRKMKETVKGYLSSFSLYFDKSTTQKFAQEAQVSDTKSTKQEKNIGWFKVCLVLFLVFTTGPKGVRSEDIGSPLIPGSTAMNSLLANKNLRGLKLSERRQMVGTEAAAMNDSINYRDFPGGKSRPNDPAHKQANPFQRPCNPGDYCRQGNKGKRN